MGECRILRAVELGAAREDPCDLGLSAAGMSPEGIKRPPQSSWGPGAVGVAVGGFEGPPSRWRGRVGGQGFGASHLPARGGPSN